MELLLLNVYQISLDLGAEMLQRLFSPEMHIFFGLGMHINQSNNLSYSVGQTDVYLLQVSV